MSFIEFKNVCKKYPGSDKNTVDNFNLDIEEKEFIAFVGPSGCGKSTTLRMMAGFEEITGGELYIDGKKVNEVAPRDRGISMVFQNYALYPHMTVEKNIGYGLKNMKMPADQIKQKVDWAINILGLEEYRYRKPKNLSGGQRQRVALGRAIVKNSDFVMLLKQSAEDRAYWADALGLSDFEAACIDETTEEGYGLLVFGATRIPIRGDFPRDSYLYRLFSTNPNEHAEIARSRGARE